eukprot:SAG31_NODE_23278_length_507_cov_1.125000_1_plen_64_part_10
MISGPGCTFSKAWGGPFAAGLVTVVALYFAIGAVYQIKVNGAPAQLPDALPQREFWCAIIGFVT